MTCPILSSAAEATKRKFTEVQNAYMEEDWDDLISVIRADNPSLKTMQARVFYLFNNVRVLLIKLPKTPQQVTLLKPVMGYRGTFTVGTFHHFSQQATKARDELVLNQAEDDLIGLRSVDRIYAVCLSGVLEAYIRAADYCAAYLSATGNEMFDLVKVAVALGQALDYATPIEVYTVLRNGLDINSMEDVRE